MPVVALLGVLPRNFCAQSGISVAPGGAYGSGREIKYLLYTVILPSSRRMTDWSVTRNWVSEMTRVLWVIHGVDWRCASGAAEVNENVSGLPG